MSMGEAVLHSLKRKEVVTTDGGAAMLDDDGALALSFFVKVQCLDKTPDLRACVQTMLQAKFHAS